MIFVKKDWTGMFEKKVISLEEGITFSAEKKVELIIEEAKRIKQKAEEGEPRFGICSQEVFQIILDRERTRADRNGHELSLLLFDISEENNRKSINQLNKVLKSRARSIDRFGWYNEEYIGIVLPNTDHTGGVKFAHDVCEMILSKVIAPPDFKVYSYPEMRLPKKTHCIKEDLEGKNRNHQQFNKDVDPIFIKKMPFWKRAFDVLGSITALILTSPFFIFVPVIIKLMSPGPVFFKQERVGYGGRIFTFLKFRTMKFNTDSTVHQNHLNELINSDKPMTKLDRKNDQRIIPFGKIIRAACIDELPQLINVLKGEMSLVGPRPCLPYEAKEYLKWHKYRFDINSGITGLWQVSGKNRLTFKEMIRLDIGYAKRMSLWLDLWILLKTIPAIITIMIDNIVINAFINKMNKNIINDDKFKEFIRHHYSDIYNVDKLELLNDKLKDSHLDLMDLMLLLSKLNKISPNYKAAKRYFGICRLIDFEKRSQL